MCQREIERVECCDPYINHGDNVPDAALSQTFSRTLQMLVFSPCLRATEVEEVVLSYLLASDHHVEVSKTCPYKIPYVEHSVQESIRPPWVETS